MWPFATAEPTESGGVDQVLAASIHEIGHAVAHKLGGLRVISATVNHRTFGGGVQIEESIDESQLPAYLVACLAGPEAEARWLTIYHGHSIRSARHEVASGACQDLENFREFSSGVYLSENRARIMAADLVKRNWKQIERRAITLAERGQLPGWRI